MVVKGHVKSAEWRKHLSESHKGKKLSAEHKHNVSNAMKGRHLSFEHKKHLAEATRKAIAEGRHRVQKSIPTDTVEQIIKLYKNGLLLKDISQQVGYKTTAILRYVRASNIPRRNHFSYHPYTRPTNPEKELDNLLQKTFPNQYKYCGNGSVRIGNMLPDFINVNGKKAVIEMFGDYWHNEETVGDWKRTELGRIMACNAYGFKCLVVWEHELKDRDSLIKRLTDFHKSKKILKG